MKKRSSYQAPTDRASRVISSLTMIQSALEPLILEATAPNLKSSQQTRTSNVSNLVQSLVESADTFINCCMDIFKDYKEVNSQIISELEKLRTNSKRTIEASKEFAKDLTSSDKRAKLVRIARDLLNSVTRIMAVADILDSKKSARIRKDMERELAFMQSSLNQQELFEHFKTYGEFYKEMMDFTSTTIQNIHSNPELCHKLVQIRSMITKQNVFLYTSSKTTLQHPKNELANSLRDQVFRQVITYIAELDRLIQLTTSSSSSSETNSCKTHSNYRESNTSSSSSSIRDSFDDRTSFTLLDKLEATIKEMNPIDFKEKRSRVLLEQQVDETIKHITKTIITHTSSKLVSTCSELRDALEDLFDSYERNNDFHNSKNEFIKRTNLIRKLLRKTIVDQFTLKPGQPIEQLIGAALTGDETQVSAQVQTFSSYAHRLIEASLIACSLSNDFEGVGLVQTAIAQLRALLPEIIYSARLLCSFPMSPEVYQNMLAYRDAWVRETELLLLSVDDIIDINDFLFVCENHILNDINKCISSMRAEDHVELTNASANIANRTNRVCDLVTAEMDNYEPCEFTQNVVGIAVMLRTNVLSNFARSVEYATDALKATPIQDPNENDFIDATRLIYDGVRDMRNAIYLIGNDDSLSHFDSESENELESKLEVTDDVTEECESLSPKPVPLDSNITEEQREEIKQQLDLFSKEKTNFERQVLKWDDKSNDIVVLAKEMCVVIMKMTDFMKGQGPYSSTTDIIKAAKLVSMIGSNLERLVHELAEQCPESKSKQELLGYLKQLPLFCNQLNLCSKVKEYTFDPDSASSLIISSKNLMTSVMSVVQTSYVASTKYTSKTGDKKPIVQWRMKPPEKKPLVQKVPERQVLIRKGSIKKKAEPVKILSEFQV